jgi:hypothetical protein
MATFVDLILKALRTPKLLDGLNCESKWRILKLLDILKCEFKVKIMEKWRVGARVNHTDIAMAGSLNF